MRGMGLEWLIALPFDKGLNNSALEMPVKFQGDVIIFTLNLQREDFMRYWCKTYYC